MITKRARLTGIVVLLLQAVVLAAAIAHGPSHEHSAREADGMRAACPPDCHAPGHDHAGHDPATCATCHALQAPLRSERQIAWRVPLGVVTALVVRQGCLPLATSVDAHRGRGPPAAGLLDTASPA